MSKPPMKDSSSLPNWWTDMKTVPLPFRKDAREGLPEGKRNHHTDKNRHYMPVTILKASAGSGKTYALAREYIRIVLSSPDPRVYRRILAVTFTNKATGEMKRRIIEELNVIATQPERSPYLADFVPAFAPDTETLKGVAAERLSYILNDYSNFSVSTIDGFFQRILRSLARESGLAPTYQVELDKAALQDETVERLLASLSEPGNEDLMAWVVDGVRDDLEATGRFTLDKRLGELVSNLVSRPDGGYGFTREGLDRLKATCDEVVNGFHGKVWEAALAVRRALDACGLDPADTNRGFLKAVVPYFSQPVVPVTAPTATFLEKAVDPSQWFAKTKAGLLGSCESVLAGPLAKFAALFGKPYREYCTALALRSQVCPMGVAGELRRIFSEVQREHDVVTIDDTNTTLGRTLRSGGAQLVPAKTGLRYDYYLLDEFQDTSAVQWDNLRPLLEDALRRGGEVLVVGDVKQSIYRWRGSDSDLLGKAVEEQFQVPRDGVRILDGNWRTCHGIVGFNNAFFPYVAEQVDAMTGIPEGSPEGAAAAYVDVVQVPKTKDGAPGCVDIRFVEADRELDEVVSDIDSVVGHGARYGDIAVLVRGNAEASAIAERLVAEGIPVVSDDALYVKGSGVVRRIVSRLALAEGDGKGSVAGFLGMEDGAGVPQGYGSLFSLAEELIRTVSLEDPEAVGTECAYVHAFMDWVLEWTGKNGNSLPAMLRDWERADPKVAAPAGGDAVRVMTVHKSKGLEFPHVILPFAEKVTLFRQTSRWCRPDTEGTRFEGVPDMEYSVTLSDASKDTLFRDQYVDEKRRQALDAMNILYVAMTRARGSLTVISTTPPLAVADAVSKGLAVKAKNLSQLLYAYVGGLNTVFGEPYDFSSMARKAESYAETVAVSYPCNDGTARPNPVVREGAKEFFLGTAVEEETEDETL